MPTANSKGRPNLWSRAWRFPLRVVRRLVREVAQQALAVVAFALVSAFLAVLLLAGVGVSNALIATAALTSAVVAVLSLRQSRSLLAATERTARETSAREVRAFLPLLEVSALEATSDDPQRRVTVHVRNRSQRPALNVRVLLSVMDHGGVASEASGRWLVIHPDGQEKIVARYAAHPPSRARVSVRCDGFLGGAVMQVFEWRPEKMDFERTVLQVDPEVGQSRRF